MAALVAEYGVPVLTHVTPATDPILTTDDVCIAVEVPGERLRNL
jgi:hypothetical protein